MTTTQQRYLDFIAWHMAEKGYPPTIRELGRHMRVAAAITALERAGVR